MAVTQQQPKASPYHPVAPFQSLDQQQPQAPQHADTGQQQQGSMSATMPNGTQLNFADDPILAKVQALNQKMISDAQSQALAEKQRELIDFGDPALVRQILGKDPNTAQAAKQNPFSTLAQLLTGHNQYTGTINTTRNAENLWYSSTRGNDLTTEGQAWLLRQSLAQNQLEANIRAQDQLVLQAKQAASEREIAAEESAYQRALQVYLQGLGTGIGATGGGGGTTNPGLDKSAVNGINPFQIGPSVPPAGTVGSVPAQPWWVTNPSYPLAPTTQSHYGSAPAPNYYL